MRFMFFRWIFRRFLFRQNKTKKKREKMHWKYSSTHDSWTELKDLIGYLDWLPNFDWTFCSFLSFYLKASLLLYCRSTSNILMIFLFVFALDLFVCLFVYFFFLLFISFILLHSISICSQQSVADGWMRQSSIDYDVKSKSKNKKIEVFKNY